MMNINRSRAYTLLLPLLTLVVTAAGCSSGGSPAATVQTIAISPVSAVINAGETRQFTVVAVYTDGLIRTLTTDVAWASSDNTVATVDAAGLATGVAAYGSATASITATVNGESRTASLTVIGSSVVLQSIEVTPAAASISIGTTRQFTAKGTYSDSTVATLTSNVTWTSDATSIATIDNTGLAAGLNTGATNITAAFEGITSPAATLTVGLISLVNTELPYPGSVDTTATYYKVSGLTPGTGYTVTMDSLTQNADLYVYPDGYFRWWSCTSQNFGSAQESCVAEANPSGELYVKIDGHYTTTGTAFTLDMTTAFAPTLITVPTLSYLESGATTTNYYKVTGLTAEAGYTVTLSGLNADSDLTVYSDTYFNSSSMLCYSWNSGTAADSCIATANTSGELYIMVDGSATTYNIDLAAATAPPLTASLAFSAPDLSYNGSVDTTASYYKVTGLTAGTAYTVTMADLTDDADLYVYLNSYFTLWLCGDTSTSGINAESCVVTANPSGELYIMVDGSYTASGANFTLSVNP